MPDQNNKTNILDSIKNTNKCQRNWLKTPVRPGDIQFFKSVLENVPKKQGQVFHEILFIENRRIIKKLYSYAREQDYRFAHNPQVNAPLLVVYVPYTEEHLEIISKDVLNKFNKTVNEDTTFPYYDVDITTSMGMHMGILALAANQIGYKTGFCSCYNKKFTKLIKRLATKDEITTNGLLCLGIGYSDKTVDYNYDTALKTHIFSHENTWNDKSVRHIK